VAQTPPKTKEKRSGLKIKKSRKMIILPDAETTLLCSSN
jgi:hypothetical protein